MSKIRTGRGKQGSSSRDDRDSQRSQGRNQSNSNQSDGYQNRGRNQNRGYDQNQGFNDRGFRADDFDDRNQSNSRSQDRNRNFDDRNRGRERPDRNRNFDDRKGDRVGQDRNRNFDDRNRDDRAGQDRNRFSNDRSRSESRAHEGHDRDRGFESRARARSTSNDDDDSNRFQSEENSPSGEQDLMVFGRNTVMAYLERMSLEDENEEQVQQIIKIFVADGSAPDERIRKITGLAKHLKIPVVACHPNKLDWLVQEGGRHQGVAAQVSPIRLLEFSEWLSKFETEKKQLAASGRGLDGYVVVALDGIEDPRNVGAIIRSAEAQGAKVILIPERRAAQVTETVAKTSAGAVVHIPIVRIVNLVKAIEELKELGFWILGLSADAPQPLYKVDLKRPLVIVVGSEGKGMRPLVKTNCDLLGAIPLTGKTESLNASVALGIAVYETVRQNSANI